MVDAMEAGPPDSTHPRARLIPDQRRRLFDAFDAGLFTDNSRTAVARLEHHLRETSEIRGLKLTDPAALTRAARELMTTQDEEVADFDDKRLAGIIDLYLSTGIQVHSPGYMGRQFSGVVPLAGVMDFVTSIANQPSSFYEAGQLPNVAEKIMAAEFNRFIGWDPARMDMVTTSGGSLANLTALLAARNRAFPGYWSDGGSDAAGAGRRIRPAVAVSQDAHYSVSRAAGILGIGESRIVRLPVDRRRRIDPDRAEAALAAARRSGLTVFCLVASAGTTSVGAFDPLADLAALAAEHGLWLHVDGAHGASLLVSDDLRGKLRGLDKADSLTWDAHKLMFVPAPCTMLFYRDREHASGAFQQQASYVFDEQPDAYSELDSGGRTVECTKRPMIMGLWALWAVYGRALFAQKIEHLCALTDEAYRILLDEPDFETVHRPEANILCFRYRPAGFPAEPAEIHRLQQRIRDQVRLRGIFFISKVNLDGVAALRVVMMNHQVTAEHFRLLLDEIRTVGRELLAAAANDQCRQNGWES